LLSINAAHGALVQMHEVYVGIGTAVASAQTTSPVLAVPATCSMPLRVSFRTTWPLTTKKKMPQSLSLAITASRA
jgi:hypothetical protein